MFKKPLFKELLICSIALYVLNILAHQHHLYYQDIGGEVDSAMHFLGGFSVALGVLWLYFFSGFFAPENRQRLNFFLLPFLGIIFIGFAWETYELIYGFMSVTEANYFYDTSLDISFGILGTIVACIYGFNEERKWIPN